MREVFAAPIAIVCRVENERRQEQVDPVVESVTLWGQQFRVLLTHCVGRRDAPGALVQQGKVVSVSEGRETEQVRACVRLEDGREIVVAIEGEMPVQEGQMLTVTWRRG